MHIDKISEIKKLNICSVLFAGFLFCYMITSMYIGGSLNVTEFSSAGRVYDFSQEEIQKTVSRWRYSEEEKVFWLRENNALKKYHLDGGEGRWRYLYIVIDKMSTPIMSANIVYYNKENAMVYQESVSLSEGENIIALDENTSMYRLGIRILNGDQQFISIESMQLRWNISGIVPGRFEKIFLISYAGFLAALCGIALLKKRNIIKVSMRSGGHPKQWSSMLLYTYHLIIDNSGERWNSRLRPKEKSFWRRLLFSLLFFWMVFANVSGWTVNREYYRYNILICCIIMLFIAALAWEKAVLRTKWSKTISAAWFAVAAGITVSDLFVNTRAKFVGIALLFCVGILIAVWNNMKNPKLLIYEIMDALEIDFIVAVLFCMVFRTKKLTIQYNGIFRSSNEFSMYAVLMLSIFLIKIGWVIEKKEIDMKRYAVYVTGAAVSIYFVLRAADVTGITAAFILLVIAGIREVYRRKIWITKAKIIIRSSIYAGAIAFICVGAVHFSTKYLPAFLHTEIMYGKETLISNVSPEQMNAFEELQPGLMKGVVSHEFIEIPTIQKNYIRKLGMFGRGERVAVFGEAVPAYSGYIQIAYRYGIFVLLPYIMLQLCILSRGFREGLKEKKDAELWLLMVNCAFVCFCFRGNPEVSFGHPLWLLYYLGAGFFFKASSPLILERAKEEVI